MAFPNHLSQEMALQHFGDDHLPDNSSVLRNILPDGKPTDHHQRPPTWLNSAILRQPNHANFLNLHTNSGSSSPASNNQWLSRSILQRNNNVSEVSGDSMMESAAAEYNNSSRSESGVEGVVNWQNGRYKAEILSHPLYEQLLSAHVACLRIATPVDQLPRIDAQLAQSQQVVHKYSALGHANLADDKELDQFMTHYVLLLCSFKDQLQQHVRVHAMEAVMACWEIEQSLQSLTGVSPGEGTGATMSDDEDEQVDSDANCLFEGSLDGSDSMGGFGPLIPTETERSLMERVRQELKHELKNGYKEKIVDIREEILRKRRAGKLPGDTTSVLKAWWQSHSKWPYPTEEDKARLVQETGLQLKQINNWFINQRKRNWHSNASSSSSSTALKSKRKRV
ncbi:homeobox protein knotted-1-like 3 [Salvia miltiorrhiza]|uniref:homeobox protein knotted-1-like 3 n=1 Tax=Salvia miltiorrhiza TaxID=226208 RepID=UPI0025AD7937|nr:homeobox protein knotted-1-like 3 [Salvia miltiorrhiza]